MGISYVKRLAASKAPWPSWEFQQDEDGPTTGPCDASGEVKSPANHGKPHATHDFHGHIFLDLDWDMGICLVCHDFTFSLRIG